MKHLQLMFGLLFCTFLVSLAQEHLSVISLQDSSKTISPRKISLKDDPTWMQLHPVSFNMQSESPKDSLFARQTFGRRSWRAAKIIIVGELATMAFFAAMPESFSNWNKNFYRNAATHWKDAFTMPPKFDDDPVMVNFIQHPLAGAIYYNGVRSQGASPIHSFLFSFAESTFFEYFIESVAERPSIQDLIVTPIAGSLIGELQNQATLLMKKNGFNFVEKVTVFIINPMYVIFNGYHTPNRSHYSF